MTINRSRLIPLLAAFLFSSGWLGAAHAAPIVVDWDVVPHEFRDIKDDHSPYYECLGGSGSYADRTCSWLWESGLNLEKTKFSFFDDRYFDGFGIGVPESSLAPVLGLGVMRIRPECKPDLAPCFDLFTPLLLRISGSDFFGGGTPAFITSSNGGLLKFPSLDSFTSIAFSGDEWRNLSWLEYGFYLPAACESNDPPRDLVCSRAKEKSIALDDLTFEPVPEPALVWLLTVGALGAGVRRRFRP